MALVRKLFRPAFGNAGVLTVHEAPLRFRLKRHLLATTVLPSRSDSLHVESELRFLAELAAFADVFALLLRAVAAITAHGPLALHFLAGSLDPLGH